MDYGRGPAGLSATTLPFSRADSAGDPAYGRSVLVHRSTLHGLRAATIVRVTIAALAALLFALAGSAYVAAAATADVGHKDQSYADANDVGGSITGSKPGSQL